MKPEDIDALFKKRLSDTSPSPSDDLWSRLQERLQDEMPVQPEAQKSSFGWARYAVAATIALLLAVGLGIYTWQHNTVSITNTVAQQETNIEPQPQETPALTPATMAEQAVPAHIAEVTTDEKENKLVTQATEKTPAASIPTKAIAYTLEATAKPEKMLNKATAPVKSFTVPVVQATAIALNKPTKQPAAAETEVVAENSTAIFALASGAAIGAEPVEIIIKRAVGTQALATEADEPTGLEKKARLAKNIFKQARNLSNGEPVELADLGIRTSSIALETKIGNQKFSKVINF